MSWDAKIKKVLTKLSNRKDAIWFLDPVDWENLGLHDYLLVIKKPMDLTTVITHLDAADYYSSLDECVDDVRLIWSNAMLYNEPGKIYWSFSFIFS